VNSKTLLINELPLTIDRYDDPVKTPFSRYIMKGDKS